MKFVLNRKGGAELLKKVARAKTDAVAADVASHAGPDADVAKYTTDRAAGAVSVPAHQQAKDGVLTRAVAAAGLDLRVK